MHECNKSLYPKPIPYQKKTSSGVKRMHLMKEHFDEWLQACAKMGIKISAQGALRYIAEHRPNGGSGGSSGAASNVPRYTFSPEAFVDALITWITADDQVGFHEDYPMHLRTS